MEQVKGWREVSPGDVIVMKDGTEVEFVAMDDEHSVWPMVQDSNGTIWAADPAFIEDGFNGRD